MARDSVVFRRLVTFVLCLALTWSSTAVAQEEPDATMDEPQTEVIPSESATEEQEPENPPEGVDPSLAEAPLTETRDPRTGSENVSESTVETENRDSPSRVGAGEARAVSHSEEPVPELEEREEPILQHQFSFGSYGRAGVGTNFHGQTGRPISVVAHAPRIVETPYLELDFYYTMDPRGPYTIRTVTTVAFTEDLFHYTGDWSAMIALRNLYTEFIWDDTVSVWAGSRMYRGDDIYLLDFWPLDSLNTLGGGIGFRRGRFDAAWQIGVNRLRDEFTFQEIDIPDRYFGATRVVLMDRQRLITSLSTAARVLGDSDGPALRIKAYFELHYLASGSYRREDQTAEFLPSDAGWTGGLQIGSWGFAERDSHANLFFRFSQGLAAYGEMSIPYGINAEKRAWPEATELMIGLSTNYEIGRFGILGAAYLRRFVDADIELYDEDDGWEIVIDVRPWVVIYGPLQFALDVSYQQRFPSGMSPTALEQLNPAVFQLAPLLVYAPLGPGSYLRPHIRLVYCYAYLNDGALDTYALGDPRRSNDHVHYAGIQVEWWYNSSYR